MDRELLKHSNVTHVKGVESISINTIRAVMLFIIYGGAFQLSDWFRRGL